LRLNPKHEFRNPKQIRNPKVQNFPAKSHVTVEVSDFGLSCFEIVSDFEIRISDFKMRTGKATP